MARKNQIDLDTRWFLFNTRSGSRIQQIPFMGSGYDLKRNATGDYKMSIPMYDPDVQKLDLLNTMEAGLTSLACVENNNIRIAGPVWSSDYDADKDTMDVTGTGIWGYFYRRTVKPLAALTQPLLDADGNPTVNTTTKLENWSLGTILKKVLQQSQLWPGGNLPIAFAPDEFGSHEDEIIAVSHKKIGSLLDDYTQREDGVDVRWDYRFNEAGDGIEYVFVTGTETQPSLYSKTINRWDMTAEKPSIRNLRIKTHIDNMNGMYWMQSGRQGEEIITALGRDDALINAKYPLMEMVDTSRGSISQQKTLQKYANLGVKLGRLKSRLWTFEVLADVLPTVDQYNVGDFCEIKIAPRTGLAGGIYRRRIAAISRDHTSRWVKITTEQADE